MIKALIGLLSLLLLSACGAPEPADTDWTLRQMAEAIRASQEAPPEMEVLLPQDELYNTYITSIYLLDPDAVSDGVILTSGGTSAQEIALLRVSEDAGAAAEALRAYLETRTGDFTGYFPEEAALLEQAEVLVRGSYVALLACGDPPAARDAFAACFTGAPPASGGVSAPEEAPAGGEIPEAVPQESGSNPAEKPAPDGAPPADAPPPGGGETAAPEGPPADAAAEVPKTPPADTPAQDAPSAPQPQQPETPTAPEQPEEAWSYDAGRLLAAWAAGDWSGLRAEDRAILDICAQVISGQIPEDASAVQRELAIHDWMLSWGSYDSNRLDQRPDFQENPNNGNPYGFLVDRRGVCLGYASTFQLFMDLLGIDCITVRGTSNNSSEHAWNQVCLDGEWYCVDVTWDDPITRTAVSAETAHRYFNVTSAYMRAANHQWDETSVPEALGTACAWSPDQNRN